MRIKGKLFDGLSSTANDAVLVIDEKGLVTSEPDILTPTPFSEIRITSRVGNTPRTLTFPGSEIFETVDHERLDAIIRSQGGQETWIHKLESNSRHVAFALVFLAGFIFWSVKWGLPWLSEEIAYALPANVNNYIGQGTLETLDERVFEQTSLAPARQKQLSQAFKNLLPENSQFNYRLNFRGGGFVGANAFALPDGNIVVTDELVELAKNDNEIHSVLLHEIGHVEHRHSLRGILSHIGLTALVLTITGDVNSAGTLVVALPNILLETSYSRDLEWEADTYSLEYMRNHGMRTEDFANFMERLEAYALQAGEESSGAEDEQDDEVESAASHDEDTDTGWLNYISSHPPSSDRADRFRAKP